jgi:cardiolipin synthase
VTPGRILTILRRLLFTVFGVPVALAVAMTLVDSYRRRGKKPSPFPVTPPRSVKVGDADGTVTTYTYGQDLYDDMLAAIRGARRQILLETYIWKGDEVGERFKTELIKAARRGVDVYVIYDAFANLVVSPAFLHFPPEVKVLRFPVYNGGVRFWKISRYGRDHRKLLVVDEEIGFIGGYNIGTAYATEWRDTHVRDHRAGRVGSQASVRRLLESLLPSSSGPQRATPAVGDPQRVGARIRLHRNIRACGCSRFGRCISKRSIGRPRTSG